MHINTMSKYFFLLLFLPILLQGQSLEEKTDEWITSQYSSSGPGAAILVARGDEILLKKGYGLANLEHNIPIDEDMVFQIGSVTKQFTSTLILMLIEEGKMKLDDDITKYIPSYPTHGHTITIHHLLNHTSGIKSYTSMMEWRKLWRNDLSTSELIEVFKDQPMDFLPGEKYAYNNSGYVLLGHIIEQVTGKSYEDVLIEKIINPLGLKNTHYGNAAKIIPKRVSGYQFGMGLKNAEYLSMTHPHAAGSIMSSVEDLYIWNQAIKSNKLISSESFTKAITPTVLRDGSKIDYGYGWSLSQISGSKTYEHSGGIFGFISNVIYIPEEDVYVAILTNTDAVTPFEISTRIAAYAIGKPYPEPDPSVVLQPTHLNSLSGVYEFEDGTVRMITVDNGQLYSQREGSSKLKLTAASDLVFLFDQGLTYLRFSSQDDTLRATLFTRTSTTTGIKTTRPLPERIEVVIPEEVLKQYVGDYEINPSFILSVTLENGQLMSQATGQIKLPLFAESEVKFYPKEFEATIEFVKNELGKTMSLILHQGGNTIEAKRKK